MRETTLKLPVVAILAATRVMLGAGLALLMVDRLAKRQRKTTGWTLFSIGVLTTPPLMMHVWGKGCRVEASVAARARRLMCKQVGKIGAGH